MNFNFPSDMTDAPNLMPPIPAVGYRFHPTNEELVWKYLKPKILGDDVEDLAFMAEVILCRHEPWDLPDMSIIKSDDPFWFFICRRDFMSKTSRRSNRKTAEGFWKPTGKNVTIKAKGTKKVIGTKKTLVFHRKFGPKSVRTGWIIHEYEYISDSSLPNQGEYVLCKLKKKPDVKTDKGELNHHKATISDFEDQANCSMASDFDFQNHSELTGDSACVESESSHHLTSNFENQNSNEPMSNSAYDASGLNHSMASSVGNQNSNDLISNSAYDGSGSCHSMTSNYENQYPNEQIVNSAYFGSEQSLWMASHPEIEDPIEMISMSPPENWIMISDFEDPLSPLHLEAECDASVQMASNSINQSTYGKGECSLLASALETDISAPHEGERSSLSVKPSDLKYPNPLEKIDMSTLDKGGLLCSRNSPESSPADALLPEFSEQIPQLLACLEAILSSLKP